MVARLRVRGFWKETALLVVGLTGGIASGKSTVSEMFKTSGAIVIDADIIARQVVAPGMPAWEAIRATFGERIIAPDGTLDRRCLGDLVFSDARRRKQLEGIVHPHVRRQIREKIRRLRRTAPDALVIQDIPLLLETGMTDDLSEIILVYVPLAVQLKRLMKRDGISQEAAMARIDAQLPMEQKRRHATIVIDNSGDLASTGGQVLEVYQRLARKARSWT